MRQPGRLNSAQVKTTQTRRYGAPFGRTPEMIREGFERSPQSLRKAHEGKALPKRKEVKLSKPDDLLAALRKSAKMLKAGGDKQSRPAANADNGAGRKTAARTPASKSSRSSSAQRKAG